MKLKVTITGPKVHDVGYRPWLTDLAMRLALRGFEVYNDEIEGKQAVIALAEGDEQRIRIFYNSAMKERPELALVESVTSEDYAGDIMPLWQYASLNTSAQMNKAIPLLLDIRDSNKRIEEIGKRTEENTKVIIDNTKVIVDNTKAIIDNTQSIPTILDEVRGLRQDMIFDADWKRRIESDIKAIKAKIGIK